MSFFRMTRRVAIASIATAAVVLGGCASNPYPAAERPSLPVADLPVLTPGSMAYARRYADDTYAEFRALLLREVDREQDLAYGLITIGATALGIAAYEGTRDALIGAALGGGTLYTLGSWDSSRPRFEVYVEGMKAVVCAKRAIEPLHLNYARAEELRVLREELSDSIDSTADAVAPLVSSTSGVPAAGQASPIESEIRMIEDLLERAQSAQVAGDKLARSADSAGSSLEDAIDQIQNDVYKAINGTRSDLASLPAIIGGLSQAGDIFVPGLDLGAMLGAAVSAGEVSGSGQSTAGTAGSALKVSPSALGNLRAAGIRLASRTSRLQGMVDTIRADQVRSNLEECGVDPTSLSLGLQLSRSQITFTAGKAGLSTVRVKGGTLPYRAQFEDLPANGLNTSVSGDTVSIIATEAIQAGQRHSLLVSDSAEGMATVTVEVGAPPEIKKDEGRDGPPTANTTGNRSGTKGAEKTLLGTPAQRVQVQGALCTPAVAPAYDAKDTRDGVFGQRTRFRIKVFQDMGHGTNTVDEEPALTKEQIQLLLTDEMKECASNRLNRFEHELGPTDICKVRVKLGLSDSPRELDAQLRERLSSFPAAADAEAQQWRQLTQPFLNQILAIHGDVSVCNQ